jgi:rhamnosyl/mannosyltransferase
MRVLCFGRFCDDLPGGIQSHVACLLRSLRGHVEFLNLAPSRDMKSARFVMEGAPVIRTRGWNVDGSLALSPALVREAWRQHRANPFDLAHLHFPDPMSHLASMALPAQIPRIISWHADIVRQKHLLRLYRPWQQRILRQAAAIIVATPAHLQCSASLAAPGIREKVHVIPYGCDLSAFAQPNAHVREIREKYPGRLVFALGRHVGYKGFDVLLEAMALLEPGIRLLLGGTGPLTANLRQQAKTLGIDQRAHFLGQIPAEWLPAYYQACDVFCLPSVNQAEAFGIVQVEAMAAGKAIINTDLGNGVNFVSQNNRTGLTVPPGNAPALAEGLRTLLRDESRRLELGMNARERANREFSIKTMGERILALYTRTAARG